MNMEMNKKLIKVVLLFLSLFLLSCKEPIKMIDVAEGVYESHSICRVTDKNGQSQYGVRDNRNGKSMIIPCNYSKIECVTHKRQVTYSAYQIDNISADRYYAALKGGKYDIYDDTGYLIKRDVYSYEYVTDVNQYIYWHLKMNILEGSLFLFWHSNKLFGPYDEIMAGYQNGFFFKKDGKWGYMKATYNTLYTTRTSINDATEFLSAKYQHLYEISDNWDCFFYLADDGGKWKVFDIRGIEIDDYYSIISPHKIMKATILKDISNVNPARYRSGLVRTGNKEVGVVKFDQYLAGGNDFNCHIRYQQRIKKSK